MAAFFFTLYTLDFCSEKTHTCLLFTVFQALAWITMHDASPLPPIVLKVGKKTTRIAALPSSVFVFYDGFCADVIVFRLISGLKLKMTTIKHVGQTSKHDEGKGKNTWNERIFMLVFLTWAIREGFKTEKLKKRKVILGLFFLWCHSVTKHCVTLSLYSFFCLFCYINFFNRASIFYINIFSFLLLLGNLGCCLMKMSSAARGRISIRSACVPTALSHIKLFAHLGAADGKQTSSCESRRLAANKTPGLVRGLGSNPPGNSVCADTRLNLKPKQSGRRDEDVHQVRAVEVVRISLLEIILTRA